jgi:hypothetical protein
LDTHFMLGMSRFALAADADLLVGFGDLLGSMGAETVAAVAPSSAAVLRRVRIDQVKIGDLEDLELAAREHGAEVLIGNSHAAHTAERLGIPLLRAGFPLYDQVGGYQRTCSRWERGRSVPIDRVFPKSPRANRIDGKERAWWRREGGAEGGGAGAKTEAGRSGCGQN